MVAASLGKPVTRPLKLYLSPLKELCPAAADSSHAEGPCAPKNNAHHMARNTLKTRRPKDVDQGYKLGPTKTLRARFQNTTRAVSVRARARTLSSSRTPRGASARGQGSLSPRGSSGTRSRAPPRPGTGRCPARRGGGSAGGRRRSRSPPARRGPRGRGPRRWLCRSGSGGRSPPQCA